MSHPAGFSPPPAIFAPPPVDQPVPDAAAAPSRGLAIAALVCGIVSIPLALLFLPGVAAVILGHLAQARQPAARAWWLAGLITGYVGIALGLLAVIALVSLAIIATIAASAGALA
jgi:hypothetical protein